MHSRHRLIRHHHQFPRTVYHRMELLMAVCLIKNNKNNSYNFFSVLSLGMAHDLFLSFRNGKNENKYENRPWHFYMSIVRNSVFCFMYLCGSIKLELEPLRGGRVGAITPRA